MLQIFTHDGAGTLVAKPAGASDLDPGDIGILFLAASADGEKTPKRVEVTVALADARSLRIAVPLDVFDAGQRFEWPLRFDNGPWAALNTQGTPFHWRAVLPTPTEIFISQRFAIDTVQIDDNAETSNPPASTLKEDYFAWGEDVLSAGAGRVAAVVSDRPDQEIGTVDPTHPAGNYIVVRHGPRLFSVYAHMMQGSAAVGVGAAVSTGQTIGKVGNSGNTTQPHLHVHFTDRWDGVDPVLSVFTSQGLPPLFSNAHVVRGPRRFLLRASTPLAPDLVVR